MTIQIQNVLTRRKEELQPVEPGKIKIYVCGVTVYGRCHVGHLRCYLSFDAVLRYLAYSGYDVRYVRNFTDIDDKIINRAAEISAGPDGSWRRDAAYSGYTQAQWADRLAEDEVIRKRAAGQDRHLAEVVADHFIDAFRGADFAPFNLFPAAVEPRVSERIPGVIALIEKIIANGYAYHVDGDVYFDVPAYHAKTGRYGALSGRDFTQMQEGARVAPTERKRCGVDFALWKRAAPGEPHWPSPWGEGRPGWHIECSAMSAEELGQPFDIHGGGQDLIFPHHENEIAQSEAANGVQFCKVWMHNGFVTVNGVKMSKSLGNFITIEAALRMAPPEVWRLLVLGTHYAHPIDFSRTRDGAAAESCETVRGTIDIAFDRLEYFYETLGRAADALAGAPPPAAGVPLVDPARSEGTLAAFRAAMDDDFNTAKALAGIGEALRFVNELVDTKAKDVRKLPGGRDSWAATIARLVADVREAFCALGLCTRDPRAALAEMRDFLVKCRGLDANAIEAKLAERAAARAGKDWARSDALRDELQALGVELRDGPTGTDWRVAR
ncbi:MAG: cysteine--tRNA ligase [Proteobacteria bacterium]|jgi:cysteinyl-tRNA synthetase|nr:cysteine--tRNA ligase [Pseudomonadota bacterium]